MRRVLATTGPDTGQAASGGVAPAELVRRYRFEEPVSVSRPSLPALQDFHGLLERVWESHWLTNKGPLHDELEASLADSLHVEHLSLCVNGTIGLLMALQASGIEGGEVITTPFTFPATPHALHWNRVRPVFCDIEEKTFNLDVTRLEELVGPETRGILPVHVFGVPCDVDSIDTLASRHGLPVIYDAAHAMGVTYRGHSILEWGDLSVLSFHATKAFTTAEGGAIISHSAEMRAHIESIRNFGIADEETVTGAGINGKLSELHSALGLLQVEQLALEVGRRKLLTELYRKHLSEVPGLRLPEEVPEVGHNYAYLPVWVDPEVFGLDRNHLCDSLRQFNVVARKYFYPLASHYEPYASLPSANPSHLPVAERVASGILCLPLYGSLEEDDVVAICAIISELHALS